jgi:hypothetical protein
MMDESLRDESLQAAIAAEAKLITGFCDQCHEPLKSLKRFCFACEFMHELVCTAYWRGVQAEWQQEQEAKRAMLRQQGNGTASM